MEEQSGDPGGMEVWNGAGGERNRGKGRGDKEKEETGARRAARVAGARSRRSPAPRVEGEAGANSSRARWCGGASGVTGDAAARRGDRFVFLAVHRRAMVRGIWTCGGRWTLTALRLSERYFLLARLEWTGLVGQAGSVRWKSGTSQQHVFFS